MKNDVTVTAPNAEPPAYVKRIGNATYTVTVHFSPTSKENLSDKIMRMLRNEVSQSKKI